MSLHLCEINVYPIKSTRRIGLEEVRVHRHGLEGDRRWMVVDDGGRFISQRDEPRLALIRAQSEELGVAIEAPGMARVFAPLPAGRESRVHVEIWKDVVEVRKAEEAANEWFSRFLERPVNLVYMDDPARRRVDSRFARRADDCVNFADGYPTLLTSRESLAELNRRLDTPVPMSRFRPNLIVTGDGPFAEDHWRRVRIGAVEFDVVKGCARCTITTIDQETAETGKEPLRTLNKFRRRNGNIYFGQNLIPVDEGVVRVGDPVDVLA